MPTTPQARGVLMGWTAPCGAGGPYPGTPIPDSVYDRIPVRVTLTRGQSVIARQTGQGTFHFRFSVPPGNYVVSSTPAAMTMPITVQANRTIMTNLTPNLPLDGAGRGFGHYGREMCEKCLLRAKDYFTGRVAGTLPLIVGWVGQGPPALVPGTFDEWSHRVQLGPQSQLIASSHRRWLSSGAAFSICRCDRLGSQGGSESDQPLPMVRPSPFSRSLRPRRARLVFTWISGWTTWMPQLSLLTTLAERPLARHTTTTKERSLSCPTLRATSSAWLVPRGLARGGLSPIAGLTQRWTGQAEMILGMDNRSEVTWSSDASPADWIGPRLGEFGGGVTSVVPNGFEAYARVLHPADSVGEGGPVRWGDVAKWSGLPLRPMGQFHSVALPPEAPANEPPWHGSPRQGTLTAPDAKRLVELLRPWTSTPDECWFAVWDGYGWLSPHLSSGASAVS